MPVHHRERRQQPLARLAVEALDALAQPLDRFGEVVALGDEAGVLRLDLLQLFLGAQVDGAEPLAVAPQLVEPLLDRRDLGQRVARRDLGERRDVCRLGLEHLADFVRDVGGAAVRGLEPLLGARLLGARFAHRLERGARRLVGLGERGLGRGAAVGGFAPRGFGRLDLGDQRAALLGERRRRAFERGALGLRFGRALAERRGLAGGAALRPSHSARSAAIAARRLRAQLGLARERLRFAARFRQHRALGRDLAARFRQLIFQLGRRGERLDRLRGVVLGGERLVAACREADLGFGERREPRGQAVRLALGRRVRVARRVGLRLRLAPRIARLALGRDRRRELGFRRLDGAALARPHRCARGRAPHRDRRGGSSPRAAAPPRSAHSRRPQSRPSATGRLRARPAAGRACSCAASVAPERAIDHADLRQPARQLGRRRDVARERLGALGERRIAASAAAPAQRIGEAGSTGASRSSPSAAPSAAS